MEEKLLQVFQHYFSGIDNVKFTKITGGHIHDTFHVEYGSGYIIQRINTHVFKKIDGMMHNMKLLSKFLTEHRDIYPLKVPELHNTLTGKPYFKDESGNCWRVMTFIPGSYAFSKASDSTHAEEAGKILGIFTKTCAGLDPAPFEIVLPDFHNINYRWDQYAKSMETALAERFKETRTELRIAEEFRQPMMEYYASLTDGSIPVRVTHNDTKFNNFLFDHNNKALSIIDLDTVMPGYSLNDYGDAIRTVVNSAAEDERDSCNVHFNLKFFQAFTKGYLQDAADLFSPDEWRLMPQAPMYLTYLQGLRFLTDHFNGDLYYPVHYYGHNLVRASVQFNLLKQMHDKIHFMTETIHTYKNQ